MNAGQSTVTQKMDQVPLGDLQREYHALQSEIDSAMSRVLGRGWFVLGQEGDAFEAEWAAYCDVDYACGVGNGTDAIELALRAAGIGPGDEVIMPALTAAFTALAVSAAGATPVFADIEPRGCTLDPASFEEAITPRSAAVIPVHLYGCPADMSRILEVARRHHLFVLEDAAQAHGARYHGVRAGGLGDAAAFSFYPSKNLGAYGDAGAVVTRDAALAGRVRALRHGGQQRAYEHEVIGTNSRLDELQAAVLRAKLPHLDRWNERRRTMAARYTQDLLDVVELTLPTTPAGVTHAFHLYVVRTHDRDRLRAFLGERGVASGVHYPRPVPLQPAYSAQGGPERPCPHAEAAANTVLSLPLFPHLEDREANRVIDAVRAFFD